MATGGALAVAIIVAIIAFIVMIGMLAWIASVQASINIFQTRTPGIPANPFGPAADTTLASFRALQIFAGIIAFIAFLVLIFAVYYAVAGGESVAIGVGSVVAKPVVVAPMVQRPVMYQQMASPMQPMVMAPMQPEVEVCRRMTSMGPQVTTATY